jgi:hypothetical protein
LDAGDEETIGGGRMILKKDNRSLKWGDWREWWMMSKEANAFPLTPENEVLVCLVWRAAREQEPELPCEDVGHAEWEDVPVG